MRVVEERTAIHDVAGDIVTREVRRGIPEEGDPIAYESVVPNDDPRRAPKQDSDAVSLEVAVFDGEAAVHGRGFDALAVSDGPDEIQDQVPYVVQLDADLSDSPRVDRDVAHDDVGVRVLNDEARLLGGVDVPALDDIRVDGGTEPTRHPVVRGQLSVAIDENRSVGGERARREVPGGWASPHGDEEDENHRSACQRPKDREPHHIAG